MNHWFNQFGKNQLSFATIKRLNKSCSKHGLDPAITNKAFKQFGELFFHHAHKRQKQISSSFSATQKKQTKHDGESVHELATYRKLLADDGRIRFAFATSSILGFNDGDFDGSFATKMNSFEDDGKVSPWITVTFRINSQTNSNLLKSS